MTTRTAVLALSAALFGAAPAAPGMTAFRPAGLPSGWDARPLGWVRVTQYTHVETRSRVTATGYVLKDRDAGLVCAVSRDWWRSRVKPGELVWVDGYAKPCVALDTMALANAKGFPQTRWVDIYMTDPVKALDFGIRHASAYVVRQRAGPFSTGSPDFFHWSGLSK